MKKLKDDEMKKSFHIMQSLLNICIPFCKEHEQDEDQTSFIFAMMFGAHYVSMNGNMEILDKNLEIVKKYIVKAKEALEK